MELQFSLLCSQEPSTGLYHELDEFKAHTHTLITFKIKSYYPSIYIQVYLVVQSFRLTKLNFIHISLITHVSTHLFYFNFITLISKCILCSDAGVK